MFSRILTFMPTGLIKCFSAIVGILFSYFIAKEFSLSEAGFIFSLIATSSFISVVLLAGIDISIVRIVGANADLALAAMLKSLLWILFLCGVFALVVAIFRNSIEAFFYQFGHIYINVALILITAFGAIGVVASVLNGLKLHVYSIILSGLLVPLISIIFLFTLEFENSSEFIYLYCVTVTVVAVLSGINMLILCAKRRQNSLSLKAIMLPSIHLFHVVFFSQFFLWGGIIITSVFLGPQEAALYSVSNRVASGITMILGVVSMVNAPRISRYYKEGELSLLNQLVSESFKVILLPSVFLTGFLIWFSSAILGLLGTEYLAAKTVFNILIVGAFLSVISGQCGTVLNMAGHQVITGRISLASGSFTLVMACVSAEKIGIVGIALSMSLGVLVHQCFLVYFMKKKLGFYPFFNG